MKKIILLFICLKINIAFGQWETVGVSGFTASASLSNQIVLDQNNNPLVLYNSFFGSNIGFKVSKFNGTIFNDLGGTVNSFATNAYAGDISLDASGVPFVTTREGSTSPNFFNVNVRKFTSSWVNVGTNALTGTGAGPLVAINSSGLPSVAWSTWPSNRIVTMTFATSWTFLTDPLNCLTPVTSNAQTGEYSSILKFSNSNTLYLCFQDYSYGGKGTVMKYNGSSWQCVGSPAFTPSGFSSGGTLRQSNLTFALDGDTPYVAFQDLSRSSRLSVMKFNGSSWVYVGDPGFTTGQADFISFDIFNGIPYVAYSNASNNSKATLLSFNGTSWVNVGSNGFSSGTATNISLDIGSNGIPYVAFSDGNNSNKTTVMRFLNCNTSPPTASAQTFCGNKTIADLVATGTALKWYTSATGGTALASTTSITTGTYYVSQTLNSCESTARTSVLVTVNVTPAPTASAQTFCGNKTIANLVATGTALKWYTAATGGVALASTTSISTGTYFVSQTLNSCESSTRTSVLVTVNVTPAPTASAQTFCGNKTIANLVATGTALKWYTAATGGVALASTTSISTGTYFVSQTLNSCESSTRTSVSVTVNVTPSPTASAQTLNSSATVANLVATGTALKWYTVATGGSSLSTSTLLATGTYYVSQTLNGCESTRTSVSVTITSLYTAIPDANFEQALFELGIDDVNGDNKVLTSAISGLTSLNVSNNFNITDLTGIQDFISLQNLNCGDNALTSLNVSGLTALTHLGCQGNQLASLNVSGLTALTTLNCYVNQLTSLNVSGLTALTTLYCDYNQLTSLNVSGSTALTTLNCSENQLTSLNVSGLTALTDLDCFSNQLTSLNLSGLTALTTLNCYSNQITSLNMSGLTALTYMDCGGNQLVSLDVGGLTALTFLSCGGNQLSSLEIRGLPNLGSLNSEGNPVLSCISVDDVAFATSNYVKDATTSFSLNCNQSYTAIPDENFEQALFDQGIDSVNGDNRVLTSAISVLTSLNVDNKNISDITGIEDFISLQELYCSQNQLTSLNVNGLSNLRRLGCSSNALISLNVSGLTNLLWLECINSGGALSLDDGLTSLNLGGCTNLRELYCEQNTLTSLNLAGLTNLQRLKCYQNRLDSLNVSGLTNLQFLDCKFNLNQLTSTRLTSLNVSGCNNLQELYCGLNELTTLNLSGLSNLQKLFCEENQLTTLNVSGLVSLQELYCYLNQLTILDTSGLINLQRLDCTQNQITTLNVNGCTNLQELYCSLNQLANLNVNGLTNLLKLGCDRNLLININVGGLTNLQEFYCNQNQLTTLNLSGLINLQELFCDQNQLTSLNVIGCNNLRRLSCYQNLLTSLDLRGLTNLQGLFCYENSLLSCISVNNVAFATSNYQKDATTIFSTDCSIGTSGSTAAVLSGSTTICVGNSINISIAITGGTSPYTVVYFNGVSNTTITGYVSGTAIPVSPATSTTYILASVTDAASNLGTGNSGTAVVTVNSSLAPAASAQTFNSSATVADLVATGTALKWYIVSTGGTSLSTSTPLATGTYYVSQTINGCESIRTTVLITVTGNLSATSPINYCRGDVAAPLTATGAAGSILKWYSIASGGTASLIAPTPLTTTVGTKNYYVSQVVGGVESARVSITVNVNAIPTTPGVITGTAAQGALVGTTTTATYSILDVAGATSYLWTPPNGVNIVSGQGTTNLTVNFNDVSAGAGAIGNLSVQSVNDLGCNSVVRKLALTKALPAAPSKLALSPPPSGTPQKDLMNISKYVGTTTPLTLTAATVATATSYDWELPTGVNRTDALGTNSALPSITVNFSGVNTGNTFSYTNASGVLTYVLRIGVKAKNGVGVSVTNNGAFSNPTTTSTAKQLTLTAVRPAAVSTVTGQITGLCGGSSYTYTITDTALASSYSVTAPAGAVVNFISSLTFTVTYPIGFVINASTTLPNKSLVITSVNGIGTSATSRTLTLSTTMPAVASISGGTTYSSCNQTFTTPTVIFATTYTWTVPSGATIVSGQNTNTVVVNYGSLTGNQTIKVKTTNSCGVSSAIKSLTLTSGSCPVILKQNESTIRLVNKIKLYPNPTSSLLSIETTNNTTIDKVVIIDLLGKVIFEGKPVNNQINVERYSAGTYIIQTFSGEEQFVGRFVKQ